MCQIYKLKKQEIFLIFQSKGRGRSRSAFLLSTLLSVIVGFQGYLGARLVGEAVEPKLRSISGRYFRKLVGRQVVAW